jgi:hypothetical protein
MKYLLTIFLFFLTLNSYAQANLFIPANGASALFYWTRIIDGIGQGMTARIGSPHCRQACIFYGLQAERIEESA